MLDSSVSYSNMLREIKNLLKPVAGETDGVGILFFAGHGGRAIDKNNDENQYNENDKLDENLCLPNYDWRDNQSFILDDTLGEIINKAYNKAPFLRIYVVIDACHSGTVTRSYSNLQCWKDIDEKYTLYNFNDPFSLSVPTYSEIVSHFSVSRVADEGKEFQDELMSVGLRDSFIHSSFAKKDNGNNEPATHLLLSGCTAYQTCKDVPIQETQKYQGIFTYTLTKTLKESPLLTPQQARDTVNNLISTTFMQNPQVEGNTTLKTRPIFT